MAGCGGCGSKTANVKYEVNFGPGGSPAQTYQTAAEARRALTAAGNPAGSSFRPVPA